LLLADDSALSHRWSTPVHSIHPRLAPTGRRPGPRL